MYTNSSIYFPQYGGYPIQPQQQMPTPQPQIPQNFLKGRPVVSYDEARAAQIDLDGSLFVFTDIGNKRIYTKQLNMDGTATMKVYIQTQDEPVAPQYVTKAQFEKALTQIQSLLKQQQQEKQVQPQKSMF